VLRRWHEGLGALCGKLPATEADQRQACQALVKPPAAAAAPAATATRS
jgi:hypothetical protein